MSLYVEINNAHRTTSFLNCVVNVQLSLAAVYDIIVSGSFRLNFRFHR